MYLFAWQTPALDGRLFTPHALEIPFVFDNVARFPNVGAGPAGGGGARRRR